MHYGVAVTPPSAVTAGRTARSGDRITFDRIEAHNRNGVFTCRSVTAHAAGAASACAVDHPPTRKGQPSHAEALPGSAETLYGGHEHTLRQTLIALRAGTTLSEQENPGEATVLVLRGRVRLRSGDAADGRQGRVRREVSP